MIMALRRNQRTHTGLSLSAKMRSKGLAASGFWSERHKETLLNNTHGHCGKECSPVALLYEGAEEVCHEHQHHLRLLQMYKLGAC